MGKQSHEDVCLCAEHIEAHVERAAADVDSGNKQLGTAVRYKVGVALPA